LTIERKELIDLLEKVIPIGVKGEEGVVEVSLEDTVRAIHRAIRDGIDHIVPTTDVIGSPWTGLQTPSIKMGDEEIFFPDPNGTGHRKKLFDEGLFVPDRFHRNIV
jgi:hypothetical protein